MARVAPGSTANEVLSAYFTMAISALQLAKEMGADASAFRATIQCMLLEFEDTKWIM